MMQATESARTESATAPDGQRLMACHECDLLHAVVELPAGGKALCVRCGAMLYRNVPNSVQKALALNLAALMLLVMANVFPFVGLELSGRTEQNVLLSGAMALYRLGLGEVGLLVFLTSFAFPLLTSAGMIYVLLPLAMGYRPRSIGRVYRMARALAPWSLLSVFMLGALIAIIKLLDLAEVIPGVSLFAFVALMIVSAGANASLTPSAIWPPGCAGDDGGCVSGRTARQIGRISCHTCAFLVAADGPAATGSCPRCGSGLHSRKTDSLTRTWALICAAGLLYIPANVYPVMTVIWFGRGDPSTILGGVIQLIEGGTWGLAMIIFFASIVVPILKLIVLSFLSISIRRRSSWRCRDRTLLFRVTEAVGAWSMVDVYVVAILAALVNMDFLATVRPDIGVTFFGAVVVITMLAAHSFDPRLIWDHANCVE